jgi:hypothetical protein
MNLLFNIKSYSNDFSQETPVLETHSEKKLNTSKIQTEVKPIHSDSKIERIVVFYTDGTFKNYTP